MKNINLNHGYYLTISGKVITLMKETEPKKNSKTGKPIQRVVGYYSTFGGALQGYKRYLIKDVLSKQECIELRDAITLVKTLEEETRKLISSTGMDAGVDTFV